MWVFFCIKGWVALILYILTPIYVCIDLGSSCFDLSFVLNSLGDQDIWGVDATRKKQKKKEDKDK